MNNGLTLINEKFQNIVCRDEPDEMPQWAKNQLFEKLDELRDIADNPFIVAQQRNAARIQLDAIEWALSIRKPEEQE